jgi:hypothetical protein
LTDGLADESFFVFKAVFKGSDLARDARSIARLDRVINRWAKCEAFHFLPKIVLLKRYLGLYSCFRILSSSYKLRNCAYLLNETFGQLVTFVGFLVDDRGTEGVFFWS